SRCSAQGPIRSMTLAKEVLRWPGSGFGVLVVNVGPTEGSWEGVFNRMCDGELRPSPAGAALHKLVEQQPRQPRLVVTYDAVLLQQVPGDIAEAQEIEFFKRRVNWLGSLRAVAAQQGRCNGFLIDHREVEKRSARV